MDINDCVAPLGKNLVGSNSRSGIGVKINTAVLVGNPTKAFKITDSLSHNVYLGNV